MSWCVLQKGLNFRLWHNGRVRSVTAHLQRSLQTCKDLVGTLLTTFLESQPQSSSSRNLYEDISTRKLLQGILLLRRLGDQLMPEFRDRNFRLSISIRPMFRILFLEYVSARISVKRPHVSMLILVPHKPVALDKSVYRTEEDMSKFLIPTSRRLLVTWRTEVDQLVGLLVQSYIQ